MVNDKQSFVKGLTIYSQVHIMESSQKYGRITLKDLRVAEKLTKSDVYRSVGVTASSYDAWEKGESIPSLPRAVRLAVVLKKPIHVICEALGLDMEEVPIPGHAGPPLPTEEESGGSICS